MPDEQKSLKSKNAPSLWVFIGANFAVFLSVVIGAQLSYASVEHFWQRISAKDGLIALCMPLAAIVLNGVLGDVAKARLVFWRWRNPLPGCRAFSELVTTDPRVDVTALKAKHGALPRSPRDQNLLWFDLYKKHANTLIVLEAHRVYLLTRDMAALSAIFAVVVPFCAFLSPIPRGIALAYSVALLAQYLIIATSARNYGRRFVLNVLSEESHAK